MSLLPVHSSPSSLWRHCERFGNCHIKIQAHRLLSFPGVFTVITLAEGKQRVVWIVFSPHNHHLIFSPFTNYPFSTCTLEVQNLPSFFFFFLTFFIKYQQQQFLILFVKTFLWVQMQWVLPQAHCWGFCSLPFQQLCYPFQSEMYFPWQRRLKANRILRTSDNCLSFPLLLLEKELKQHVHLTLNSFVNYISIQSSVFLLLFM